MKSRLPVFLRLVFSAALTVCFLLNCNSVSAQTSATATLSGTILDPSGRPISGAQVTATRPGATKPGEPAPETKTADDGSFKLALAPGAYRIIVTQPTFTRAEREVELSAGQQVEWKLRLEIEPLSAGVVVTAETFPVEAGFSTTRLTTVTRQEINQRQARTLPDLLGTLPGFSIARTGREGGITALFLDGGNSNHAKVLLDGAPMNDSGGFADFSNFTLDNIEKIEVIHGAESALYGTDAMSGVIQIFTRRGRTRTPELDLVGEGGSFSTGRGAAEFSGLLGRLDYAAEASYFSTAGQGVNDGFLNRSVSGNFGWRFSDTNTLRLVVRNTTSDAGIAGPVLFLPPDPLQHNHLKDFVGSLVWNAETGNHWRWHVAANEASLNTTIADPPFFTSHSQFNRAGLDARASYVIRNSAYTAGYMYEVENGYPGALFGEHARRNNQAGYVDARWQVTRRLTLNAGARAEANATFGTRVVPRGGVAFLLREGNSVVGETRLRVFYGQGIDAPRLDQAFGTDPCFSGNPNLRAEQSLTASGGIEQAFASGRVHVSADYFYNRFRDVISFTFLPPTGTCIFGTGTFFNTDLARARGVNLSAEVRATRWLNFSGHYSYDDSRVLVAPNAFDPSQIAGNRLFRRPVNSGSLVVNFSAHRVDANFTAYFAGPRTDSDFLGLGFTQNSGYARFDAAVSYRVQRRASLFVRVANLFDNQYQEVLGYPALGREVRAGIKLTIGGE